MKLNWFTAPRFSWLELILMVFFAALLNNLVR